MRVYATVLAEKAARKRAMLSTAEISIDDQQEESDSEADEMPNAGLLPELRKKSAAKKAKASSAAQMAREATNVADGNADEVGCA